MTDTTVLEIALITSFIGIMALYYSQSRGITPKQVEEDPTPNSSTSNEKFVSQPIILPNKKIALGQNFHKTFNEKRGVNLTGWRQWWIDNKTKSNVPEDDTFKCISIRQHLDTMDNLVNNAEINKIINNGA
jgi:hypothetical protein